MTTAIFTPAAEIRTPTAETVAPASALHRVLTLIYGVSVYTFFLGTFLYAIGFVANAVVPKGIDSGAVGPIGTALLVNGAFLALFAVQHAIMARPAFKRRWTKIVPQAAERSTFVLATCAILASMFWLWQPMPGVVWHVEGPVAIALWTLSGLGWATVLVSTFLIDHFELFGLRQVVIHALGRPFQPARFRERGIYKLARHPLMLGFLVAFWATPHMTWGHLFFAVMCTGYIAVGLQMEERDLVAAHGEKYLDYRRRVRSILPLPRRAS